MKGNRDMIFNYSPIEIYEMVLSGQIKKKISTALLDK